MRYPTFADVSSGLFSGSSLGDIAKPRPKEVQKSQARLPLADTARSVVRYVPVVGCAGSTTCYHQPVSMPRVSILENPERLAA